MKTSLSVLLPIALLAAASLARADQAADTNITVLFQQPGVTPFISKISLQASDLTPLRRIQFSIAPKPGSVTRPLTATYTKEYLAGRGYINTESRQITVPVFGLYNDYSNRVTLTYSFADSSSKQASANIQTARFDDPPFNTPTIVQARNNGISLSYDYILVASSNSTHSPTIIDTDGVLRWVGTSGVQHHYVAFFKNGIYQTSGSKLLRMELDGTVTYLADYASQGVTGFSHNIDPGKTGLILDVNTTSYLDCVHFEVDAAGKILKKWNLANIISSAMVAGGDDPSDFVRKANGDDSFNSPSDWAHDNAACYRPSGDSVIISSRENFVICIDYNSGSIKWIFGDTSKRWYQYPSLRKFAMTIAPGTTAPDGQHAVSITKDNKLLLFDNGQQSAHHSPPGPNRTYSAARKYSVNHDTMTATELDTFDNNKSVRSGFRSSVYEDAANNYLVDYAVAENGDGTIRAEILGISASREKVFDYSYPTQYGFVAYRALPIHLESLQFSALPPSPANAAASEQLEQ